MSLELELQSDLHEAFRLLYEDEDDFDADWFDDDTEADASTVVKIDQPVEKACLGSSKYSKKRLQDMLEALIPSDPNLLPSLKRRRLLPSGPDLIAPETSSHDTTFSSNSLTSYRNRLLSYTLPTYNSKPARLQPQNVARYGWMNQGRERIRCETCDAAWFLKGFDDPRLAKNPRTRRRMTDMFEEQLTQAHKKACPWRIQQSPATIHSQLLAFHPLLSSRLAPIARELERDYVHGRGQSTAQSESESGAIMDISHGLPQPELNNLIANLQSVSPDQPVNSAGQSPEKSAIGPDAANLAFFGWQPYRPTASGSGGSSTPGKPPIPDVVHCSICDRKLGLSHFRSSGRPDPSIETHDAKGKGKVLDVIREHREFCPIKVYSVASDSIEEDPIDRRDLLDVELPWWRSAMILRSDSDRQGIGNTVVSEERPGGNRLEKKEVLARLRAILGEKQPGLGARKHIRTVF